MMDEEDKAVQCTCKTDDSEISDMSSSGSDSPPEEEVLSPDGGWGWMVCLGSFVTNFVLDGTMFSFGVLLIDLLDYFGQTKSKTAWVGSALVGMSMMMGPFVSMLLERYTIRRIAIIGTLVAVSGFVVSIFSPNIELLIITYGVIGGIGFCMMFIPAIIVVGLYFDKRRALATGIATSGSGLGTFAYAYLTDILLRTYGWRGTILILGGILLNVIVCGLIFRPLVENKTRHKNMKVFCTCKTPSSGISEYPEASECFLDKNYDKGREILLSRSVKRDFIISSVPLGLNSAEPADTYGSSEYMVKTYKDKNVRQCTSVVNLAPPTGYVTSEMTSESIVNLRFLKPMARKDIFYSGSIQNIPEVQHARDLESAMATLTQENIPDDNSQGSCLGIHKSDLACFELLKEPTFILLLLCMVTWTAQIVFLTYLPDMAMSKGIPRTQCAFLISIVGITNIMGRLISGFITDCLHVRSIHIYACALAVSAIVNFVMPFCDSFYLFATFSGIFGFCMGSIVSLRTIVLADHLGISKLTQSFGLIALFQGIGFIINPPLAGFLFDMTQSYVYPFALVGSLYVISTVVCLPLLRRRNATSGTITIEVSDPDSSDDSMLDEH